MRMEEHMKQLIEKYALEASRLSGQDAVDKYQQAYLQARELGNPFTVRACATNLGAALIALGNKDEAEEGLKYLAEAVPPYGNADSVSKGDLFFNFALGYKVLGRHRETASYLESAWQEYKGERDNTPMELETLKRLVQNSIIRQKHEETLKWYGHQEEAYRRSHRPQDCLLVMVQRIKLQHRLGHTGLDDAVETCCGVMDTVRQQGVSVENIVENHATKVGLLVKMAVVLTELRNLPKARDYLEEALSLFEAEDGKTAERAVVLQNLGVLCNYLGDWSTSLPHHTQAAAIYHHIATLPPHAAPPLLPARSALRCQGHCLANHAYALVHLGDEDEARVLFEQARELANRTDDLDTKWQMEEALGAVHFRMACHDLDLGPLDAETKVALPPSRLSHLEKSIRMYKTALKNLMGAPRGSQDVQDRVLEKLTLVQTFTKNASMATVTQQYIPPTLVPSLSAALTGDGGQVKSESGAGESEDSSGEEEEEDEDGDDEDEEDSSEEEGEEEEGGGRDVKSSKGQDAEDEPDDSVSRESPQRPSIQRLRLEKTIRTPPGEEEDDDESQVKALYEAQLGTETLQGTGAQRRVQIQHPRQYSSSAESGSTETDSDDSSCKDSDADSDDDTRSPEHYPPVPSQSPPSTFQASGTYETPQADAEMHINQLYGSPHSRPRSPVARTSNYAEIDFSERSLDRSPERSGELAHGGPRRFSLNFFISSSDDDEEGERTKQRKPPAAGHDGDYETVEVGRLGQQSQSAPHKGQEFNMEGASGATVSSKEQKDSKTCSIM